MKITAITPSATSTATLSRKKTGEGSKVNLQKGINDEDIKLVPDSEIIKQDDAALDIIAGPPTKKLPKKKGGFGYVANSDDDDDEFDNSDDEVLDFNV